MVTSCARSSRSNPRPSLRSVEALSQATRQGWGNELATKDQVPGQRCPPIQNSGPKLFLGKVSQSKLLLSIHRDLKSVAAQKIRGILNVQHSPPRLRFGL